MGATERLVERIEEKLMPEGTSFSEEQWERLSDEIFEGVRMSVLRLEVDPDDQF